MSKKVSSCDFTMNSAMEYLKTLDNSELINYLEIEPQSVNFKMVEKIILSREKNMIKRVYSLNKLMEMYKSKCSELSVELEQKNCKCIAMEGNIKEFRGYKMICDELKEKVTCLEEDCKIITKREMKAMQNVTNLSADLEKLHRRTNEELTLLRTENKDLKCMQQKIKDETEAQRRRCEELGKMLNHAKKLDENLNMYRARCSELSKALEEEKKKVTAVESKLADTNGYKMICYKLREKVARLEEDCKVISEREKSSTQNVTYLLADLEQLNRRTSEELIILKTENEDLKKAKQKAENETQAQKKRCQKFENMSEHAKELDIELKVYKARCSELSTALEVEKRKSAAVESELEEFKGYKMICDKLEEKVTLLKINYNVINEREKAAIQNVNNLSADLERVNRVTSEELIVLKTENKDLKNAKQTAEDEIEAQKKRLGELENMLEHAKELDKDLKTFKTTCSALSTSLEEEKQKSTTMEGKLEEFKGYKKTYEVLNGKVTHLEEKFKIVSEREKKAIQNNTSLSAYLEEFCSRTIKELNELKTKNSYLEFAKGQAEDEIEAQKKIIMELEQLKYQLEKDYEVSEARSFDLSVALEEEKRKSISKLEELKESKINCELLKENITLLEEDCSSLSEKEKIANQSIINLKADLENVNRSRNEELMKLKTRNEDLESLKRRADNELESQKKKHKDIMENSTELEKNLHMSWDKCSELSMALEDMRKKSFVLEPKLEKSKRYKMTGNEFNEKVDPLEGVCKNSGEREKKGMRNITNLQAEPEKFSNSRNDDLIEVRTKNNVLECNSRVPANHILEIGSDSENESTKEEPENIQRKTIGGANITHPPRLSISTMTSIHKCTEKRRDSAGSTPNSHSAVKGQVEVSGEEQRTQNPNKVIEPAVSSPGELGHQLDKEFSAKLYTDLLKFREDLVKEARERVMTCHIFGVSTLQRISEVVPRTTEELLGVRGVNKEKVKNYGDRVLEIIESVVKEYMRSKG